MNTIEDIYGRRLDKIIKEAPEELIKKFNGEHKRIFEGLKSGNRAMCMSAVDVHYEPANSMIIK